MTSATGNPFALRKRTGAKGAFSFVELLVASAILAVGIVTILQALSFTSRIAGLTFDIVNGVFVCEDKMQELEFIERRGIVGDQPREGTGTIDKFNWQYSLDLDHDLRLYRLNFNLAWNRTSREENLNLYTYLR